MPTGWSAWTPGGTSTATVVAKTGAPSSSNAISNNTDLVSFIWYSASTIAEDLSVAATMSPVSSIGTVGSSGIFARGTNPGSSTFTGYALFVVNSGGLTLARFDNGTETDIESILSIPYGIGSWLQITLECVGGRIRCQLYVVTSDNYQGQYLHSDGSMASSQAWAIVYNDPSPITGDGYVGCFKSNAYSYQDWWDDFTVQSAAGDSTPPTVSLTSPTSGTVNGTITATVTATDNIAVQRVDYLIDGEPKYVSYTSPYSVSMNTATWSNGNHTIQVRAYDQAGNSAVDPSGPYTVTASNDTAVTRPTIVNAQTHIKTFVIDYSSNFASISTSEAQAVLTYTDIDTTTEAGTSTLWGYNPNLSFIAYNHLSSLYNNYLLDWLNWADANSVNREDIFYHVTAATTYLGGWSSESVVPSKQFYVGFTGSPGSFTGTQYWQQASSVTFPNNTTNNSFFYVGRPDRFREINFASMTRAKSGGWVAAIEYCTAIDGNGAPTSWTSLATASEFADTTNGFTQDGQISFTPPSDWLPCKVTGQVTVFSDINPYRFYYVRWSVTTAGTSPAYGEYYSRDFTGNGYAFDKASGTIPAFDSLVDQDEDGYLSNSEYNDPNRDSAKTARFFHESRSIKTFGDGWYDTRYSLISSWQWVLDYMTREATASPHLAGWFGDDAGHVGTDASTIESQGNAIADFAGAINYMWQNVPGYTASDDTTGHQRFYMPNLSSRDNAFMAEFLPLCPAYFDEYYLNPYITGINRFETQAADIADRQAITSPEPIGVIDCYWGDNWTEEQKAAAFADITTRYAMLCLYYMIRTPGLYVSIYGGQQTAGTLEYKWCGAAQYDVGLPTSAYSVFATGTVYTRAYKVYVRAFDNATVIYKPLTDNGAYDADSTTHDLTGLNSGGFKKVNPDGTLGNTITSIALTGGQGAILIPQ